MCHHDLFLRTFTVDMPANQCWSAIMIHLSLKCEPCSTFLTLVLFAKLCHIHNKKSHLSNFIWRVSALQGSCLPVLQTNVWMIWRTFKPFITVLDRTNWINSDNILVKNHENYEKICKYLPGLKLTGGNYRILNVNSINLVEWVVGGVFINTSNCIGC